jgi:hypothetical protein
MEFQSYLFMNEKLTGIQQNADKYYLISAEFEMVLVKGLCGIKIPHTINTIVPQINKINIPVYLEESDYEHYSTSNKQKCSIALFVQ